jgi:hypothetical protein
MAVPNWLSGFIDPNAFTLSLTQLSQLDPTNRSEVFWKYIILNILKPSPPVYSYFITSEDEDFTTSADEYLQVETY